MSRITATLYDVIQSELQKEGFNEFFDGETFEMNNIVFFEKDFSFIQRILKFEKPVETILNEKIFFGQKLKDTDNDRHFKKAFLFRFLNREINFQTLEAFKAKLGYTFLINETYINSLYTDLDKYLSNEQVNNQTRQGSNTNDSRSAFSELPQDQPQLDVDSTVMLTAKENTISRNKQTDQSTSGGSTKNYRLDEFFKTNGLLEKVLNDFDKQCFLQVW